jgi:hypothetical protein
VDLANDGAAELVVTNGRPRGPGRVDPDDQEQVYYDAFDDDPTQVWVRRPGGGFVDAAGQVGLVHREVGLGVVTLDHDRDGRMDLLVTQPGAAPVLYRNVTEQRRHWLGIRLRDPASPGDARGLGARLEVVSAGRTTTHWMHTSGSYQSQAPAEVHVGLGRDARPVRVRVWWPGADAPQVLDAVRTDRVVTITREP